MQIEPLVNGVKGDAEGFLQIVPDGITPEPKANLDGPLGTVTPRKGKDRKVLIVACGISVKALKI